MNIIKSLNDENTFFIFRDNGKEVKAVLSDGKIFASHGLHYKERTHINRHYLKRPAHSIYNKLNELTEAQIKDVELKINKILR